MKTPRKFSAFTLIELLVVISIIAILASFAVPAVTGALAKGQMMQSVNNGRQIQQLTQINALDATTTGDATIIGWPGNISFTSWIGSLTNSISTNDVARLFSAAGVIASWTGTSIDKSAFKVYQVSEASGGDTVFLTTANWTAPGSGGSGTALVKSDLPYGDKGFVVVRKGGDAQPYLSKQATRADTFFGSTTNALTGIPAAQ